MLSVASGIGSVRSVGLDDQEAVEQAVEIGNAKVCCHQRQASPVEAAAAVGKQVPGTDGEGVVGTLLGSRFAFVLDARLRIQYGRQFFAAARLDSARSVTSSIRRATMGSRCSAWSAM